MRIIPLIEGFMAVQALVEVLLGLLLMTGVNRLLKNAGLGFSTFWSALGVWIFFLWYMNVRLYPPVPFSVKVMYGVVAFCGLLMWVSKSDQSWEEFRRPIINVLDGITPFHRVLRAIFLIGLPLGLGAFGFQSRIPVFEEPIELRTVMPAPPATTNVHGHIYALQTIQNPFRVNEQGKFDQAYSFEHGPSHMEMGQLMRDFNDPRENPWHPQATAYMRGIQEGGAIYFQECHFCHGGNLNGLGIFSPAFRPFSTNFTDRGTIAQIQESYAFWRVSKGGLEFPPQGFPWSTVMPNFEQHLTVDEIWKVIMFTYWHTGFYPRTWD